MENVIVSFQELLKLPNDAPYYFNGERSYTTGWKMHLFLNSSQDKFPKLHDETILQLSKFLIDNNLEHKFKNGCDGANTFCIYVGNRDECEKLAEKLIEKFGDKFQKLSPLGNSFSGSDQNLFNHPNIGIRFDGVNERPDNSPFLRYGENGIPKFLHRTYFASTILGRKITLEQEDKLKRVACHLILAKYCGEKYLGKNYHQQPWDKEIFDEISMFSATEIKKYTQACIAMFNPVKFIKSTSLTTNKYDINVDEKVKAPSKEGRLLNKLYIKNHGFSLCNADNIALYEICNCSEKELLWSKADKPLAKYLAMKDGHSFVSLFDDKGKEEQFLLYDNQVYSVHNGKAEKINNIYLATRIKNIASESFSMKSRMENFSIKAKSPKTR